MPTPLKACKGEFSPGTIAQLQANLDRDQWKSHECIVCGEAVAPVIVKSKWEPEPHWPSVPRMVVKRSTARFSRYRAAPAAVVKPESYG